MLETYNLKHSLQRLESSSLCLISNNREQQRKLGANFQNKKKIAKGRFKKHSSLPQELMSFLNSCRFKKRLEDF